MDIVIDLPEDPNRPAYQRLAEAIRESILAGRFRPGERLPPTRVLATNLSLARNTVLEAYEQLIAEGYLAARHGSGTYVAPDLPDRAFRAESIPNRPASQLEGQPPRLSDFAHRLLADGIPTTIDQETQTPSNFEFRYGTPSLDEFPLDAWRTLTKRVLDYPPTELLGYGPTEGLPQLRQALARYLQRSRGVRCDAGQVLIVNGSQQALDVAARVLVNPGDVVATEDPGYRGARAVFHAVGARIVPVPCDSEGIRVSCIPESARIIYVTPSHQFPTGAVMSAARRLELLALANRTGAVIIEDDYDSEFHYAGRPTACVQGLDAHDRTIYIGTFTKSLFPGLRIAYMVLPPQLVAPMTVARTLMDGHSASIPQLTLARFMEGGHFGAHVRAMRGVYADRLDALVRLVRKHLADFVEPKVPVGGMQMPCILIRNIPEREAIDAARRAGIDLLGLAALHASSKHKAGFLMGFAAYTPDEMEAAVRKLAGLLRPLERR